jgi:hypothetical protein
MDPWKRYRLLACIAVILAIFAAGVYGWLNPPPPPERPPPWDARGWEFFIERRPANPLERLEWEYAEAKGELFWTQLKWAAKRHEAATR